jgi:hypothetical protein
MVLRDNPGQPSRRVFAPLDVQALESPRLSRWREAVLDFVSFMGGGIRSAAANRRDNSNFRCRSDREPHFAHFNELPASRI